MNPRELVRTLSPTAWLISAALVLVLLIAGWWLVIGGPAHDRKAAAQAKADATMSGARAGSATEAAAIADAAHRANAQSETLSRETADAIRKAPGADQRLDPDLNRVARERLCKRAAYSGAADCLQLPGRAQPAR